MITPTLKELLERYRGLKAQEPGYGPDDHVIISFAELSCLCEYILSTGAQV